MRRSWLSQLAAALAAFGLLPQLAAAQQAQAPPGPPMEPGPAAAQRNCDGYSEMARAGDGMTREGVLGIWRAPQDRTRRNPSYMHGVAYCTRALELLAAEYPQYWLRKVSLLQSRALHRALNSDFAGALADLNEASAAAAEPQHIHYLRSLDVNTNFIRAYALIESGDRAAGEALAMETWARRPFSRATTVSALMTIGSEGRRENIDALLLAAARLNPSRSGDFFTYLFETGRFADALGRFSELKAPVPVEDQAPDKWTHFTQQERKRVAGELFWQHTIGRKAFALAALGRVSEAREALAEARARLDAAVQPPAALPRRTSERDEALRHAQTQANGDIQSAAPPIRELWSALTEARIAAGEGRLGTARDALAAMERLPATYAIVDIVKALGPAARADLEYLERTLPKDHLGLPRRHLTELFKLLLDGETQDRAHANRIGCEESDGDAEAALWVCFEGADATLAVAEERVLLRAANMALERGRSHFIIEARDDIQHLLANQSIAYESKVQVRFVEQSAQDCWRCLDAAEIETRLGTIYAPPTRGRRTRN